MESQKEAAGKKKKPKKRGLGATKEHVDRMYREAPKTMKILK